jgi:hypothetical protein
MQSTAAHIEASMILPATKRSAEADLEANFIFTPSRRMSIIESHPLNDSEDRSAYIISFPSRRNSSMRPSSSSKQHASANKFLASTSETAAIKKTQELGSTKNNLGE